jgi:hypothetical protein
MKLKVEIWCQIPFKKAVRPPDKVIFCFQLIYTAGKINLATTWIGQLIYTAGEINCLAYHEGKCQLVCTVG